MSPKLNNIKSRFLLQIVFFIIFCILTAGVVWFGSNRGKKNAEIGKVFAFTGKQLVESYAFYSSIRLKIETENNVGESQSNYINQFNSAVKSIRDTFLCIENNKIFSVSEDIINAKDTFLLSLKNYETAFNYLLLGYQQIGASNIGNINSIESNSDKLIELASAHKIQEFYKPLSDLKKFETELLLKSDLRAFVQIQKITEEFSNMIVTSLDSDELSNSFIQLLNSYNSELNAFYKQIKLIGPNGDIGLVATFQKEYEEVFNRYNSLVSVSLKKGQLLNSIFIGILFIIYLILIVLYIILLLMLQKDIINPVTKFIDFTYNLSKGKLLTNDLSVEFQHEFNLLSTNLNKINYSLKDKKKFIDGVLKQKFDIDVSLQGKSDTFGKTLLALKENLRKTREEQIQHAEQNQLRRYLNEGIAKFADILRENSDDLNKLTDAFIRELVKYLDAIQGGLFLLKEVDEKQLYLASAFAYNRKKYLSKEIEVGEGLVGTCAVEQKTINLTEIPEDYIEITSGLGDTPPKNLLLLPIMSERTLIGIIELASLNKFAPHQIEAGEKISENLASTIITAKINTKTAELLKKSQLQAAEMAEQEEEMRQNMEELKATQEESARREEELESIINALHSAFYVIEYEIDGTISNANNRLLILLNSPLDAVIGRTHAEIFGHDSKVDALLFARVSDGNTVELTEEVYANKKQFVFKNTFSPIQTKNKKTIKILNIISMGN